MIVAMFILFGMLVFSLCLLVSLIEAVAALEEKVECLEGELVER